MLFIPVMVVSVEQEDCGQDWPGQKARPYLKNNQNLSTAKKKKKKKHLGECD
jgi:hypothetical protein